MRRALGILFFVGPFIAGAVAASSARHDLRLIAMAVVATSAAWLLRPSAKAGAGRIALTFAAAAVAAVGTAIVAGARAPFGVIAVAAVVAGFATVAAVLLSTARGSPTGSSVVQPNER